MRTRTITAGLVGALALVVPAAAAQAATKAVDMGSPPSAQKALQQTGSDVNDFFPHGIAIHVGDSVQFVPVGFHSVDLVPKGGLPLPFFAPTGQKISGEKDAAGASFWFNGLDQFGLSAPLAANQNFGKKATYNGSKRALSGAPLGNNPKPFTVKFTKAGSFTYYCNVHLGMKGVVSVKPKKAKVPSAKADAKVVKTQIAAALKVAKTLGKKTQPANTVDVGEAGPHGVEFFDFAPKTLSVSVGTTVNFRMPAGSTEGHTATTGPGNPDTEPMSYLGQLAGSFQGPAPAGQALYPSEPPGNPASLTPSLHGNGFWSTGLMDTSNATPLPASGSVTFGAAGDYQFYCLIHTNMHGTVHVQ